MIFLKNLKKLFTEEILTTKSDSYSKEESDKRYVEAVGDSEIDGKLTVKSIKAGNIEIY